MDRRSLRAVLLMAMAVAVIAAASATYLGSVPARVELLPGGGVQVLLPPVGQPDFLESRATVPIASY